jgi:selenocysteine lyase/cysteine desulfurase
MGVRCAARGGNIRLSPHVYNTEADIDRAVEALGRFI